MINRLALILLGLTKFPFLQERLGRTVISSNNDDDDDDDDDTIHSHHVLTKLKPV